MAGVGTVLDELYAPEDASDVIGVRRIRGPVTTLRAVLWDACSTVVDLLYDDLRILEIARVNGPDTLDVFSARDFFPSPMAEQYSIIFVRRFLASTMAITDRFAGAWREPANTAEDVATHLILGQAEMLIDTYEYKVPVNWRHDLEGFLLAQPESNLLDDLNWQNPTRTNIPAREQLIINPWFIRFVPGLGANPYADPDTWPDLPV
ncbi:hypothetical protein AX769_20870 (plasmid) [Frondihabitans sp. PAMC 28766]|nr:hypothetical protein AX769_20870 [Frondihabitans sp. PAMC 28766]